MALLHAPVAYNPLGVELTKLQKANKECGSSSTLFPARALSSQTYTTRSFRKGGYSNKRGGQDRVQD